MLHIIFYFCSSLASWIFPRLECNINKSKGYKIGFSSISKLIEDVILFSYFQRYRLISKQSQPWRAIQCLEKQPQCSSEEIWWLKDTGKWVSTFTKVYNFLGEKKKKPSSLENHIFPKRFGLRSLSGYFLGDWMTNSWVMVRCVSHSVVSDSLWPHGL